MRAWCTPGPRLRATSSGYPKKTATRYPMSQRASGSEREALAPGRLTPTLAAETHR